MYMCFNQETSIVAFIVGSLFTILNLKKGHIKFNLFIGLISIFIVIIQLLEFLIWRNLNDTNINYIASFFIVLITTLHPIIFLLFFSYVYNKTLPYWLIAFMIFYIFINKYIFKFSSNSNDITTIDKSGKLLWPYFKENSIEKTLIYWILIFIFIIYIYNLKNKKINNMIYATSIITLVTMFVVYLQKPKTFITFGGIFTTLWCLFCIFIPIIAYII